MAKRFELSDTQWQRIERLLPGKAGDRGVTAKDNRAFVNGVFWVLRSGGALLNAIQAPQAQCRCYRRIARRREASDGRHDQDIYRERLTSSSDASIGCEQFRRFRNSLRPQRHFLFSPSFFLARFNAFARKCRCSLAAAPSTPTRGRSATICRSRPCGGRRVPPASLVARPDVLARRRPAAC